MTNPYDTTLSDAATIIIRHQELLGDIARMGAALGLPEGLAPWLVISCARDLATTLKVYRPDDFARFVADAASLAPEGTR